MHANEAVHCGRRGGACASHGTYAVQTDGAAYVYVEALHVDEAMPADKVVVDVEMAMDVNDAAVHAYETRLCK